jgi:hypothetical protein
MTDWQDAVNLMKVEEKKRRVKKKKDEKMGIGLRCWECGLFIDNYRTGHYCSRCLVKNIKKYMNATYQDQVGNDKSSQRKDSMGDDGTDKEKDENS